MTDEKVNSHDFWLRTCCLDTYYRSSGHARVDTPWNAFTSDDRALVCTLWADRIASVFDPAGGRVRRFVRLGGKSRQWKGVAKSHGGDAKKNLERAIALSRPVFGYEAEPQPAALQAGERKVKYFCLNKVSQLHVWIGLRLEDLKERLDIDGAFERLGIENDTDSNRLASGKHHGQKPGGRSGYAVDGSYEATRWCNVRPGGFCPDRCRGGWPRHAISVCNASSM